MERVKILGNQGQENQVERFLDGHGYRTVDGQRCLEDKTFMTVAERSFPAVEFTLRPPPKVTKASRKRAWKRLDKKIGLTKQFKEAKAQMEDWS